MKHNRFGFTIVELLIVIVVIGILAAISIVAYNGISNQANDSAVKSDLTNFAKQIEMDFVEKGSYRIGGSSTTVNNSTTLQGMNVKVSRGSYATDTYNFYYCVGRDASVVGNKPMFRILARSKSGKQFQFESTAGLSERSSADLINSATACSGIGSATFSYGYHTSLGWFAWTNG